MSGPVVTYELCDADGRVLAVRGFGIAVDLAKAIANKTGESVTVWHGRVVAVMVPDRLS